MSNIDKTTPEIAGAICAPTTQQEVTMKASSQQRQPTSLQGLLKFAMEATKAEDSTHESKLQPLDETKRRFLEKALESLTIDVVKLLLEQVAILEKVSTVQEEDKGTEFINALDTISEYVCDLDTANDFHKIGGFVILEPCLKCKQPQIRAQSCNLLAELCQNNPYCQRVVLENGFMPILMNIIENDPVVAVVVKALYAVSCIIRQNSTGCTQFIQYRGIQIFLETLKRGEDKLNIKIGFLLNALCVSQPDFKSRLIFVGYIPVLFALITPEPKSSDEHILALLFRLIEDNTLAIQECRQNNHNAKETLEKYLEVIKGKEEYCNEEEYCHTIYNILFPKN